MESLLWAVVVPIGVLVIEKYLLDAPKTESKPQIKAKESQTELIQPQPKICTKLFFEP